jgi:chromosomal replication initiation ATPase DnaA
MLAMKKVQQFCDGGLNELFVCFNSALADYLETRLYDANVANFHGLCHQAAVQMGRNVNRETDQKKLFEEMYPQILLEFAEETGRVYDAIVVDEGQDFHENYWIALESLLKSDGYLFIFYDDNQNIFHGSTSFGGLIQEAPFSLNQNCRNTKFIHNTVMKFHSDPTGITSYAPEGREPEWILYDDTAGMNKALQKVLHRLVNEENVSSQDIVILTPKGMNRSSLKPGLKLGNFTLSDRSTAKPTDIMVTTIQRFKGLERKVVIITELDPSIRYDLDMLMYIGCSRARTHLIVLHDVCTIYFDLLYFILWKERMGESMKYRDLVQFESVTEVIQLLKANQKETAAQLVETYVISDRMADLILHRILPALKFSGDNQGRGLFIVGNYGTGKSHLMAEISSICEHADLLERVQHPAVRQGLEVIAGKFIVVRQETSATKMALRDVVRLTLKDN